MAPSNPITVEDIDRAPEKLPAPVNTHAETDLTIALQRVAVLSGAVDSLKEERNKLKEEISELKRSKNTSEALDKLIEPYARRTY